MRAREVPMLAVEIGLVVEEAGGGFCGAVVAFTRGDVTLEDRHGHRRVFPLVPAGFALDGELVTLQVIRHDGPPHPSRTASGSIALPNRRARVAREGRILVEGVHDAALVQRVWGEDLAIEGVVVELLDGVDDLAGAVRAFAPGPGRRLGVLVDHLVTGSKESRIVATLAGAPHVLVTGHPYVDIWQAVRPSALGIPAWPVVPKGTDWKTGVCAALGVSDPTAMWRRVLAAVCDYTDLEVPLLGAVEELIDFVTASPG